MIYNYITITSTDLKILCRCVLPDSVDVFLLSFPFDSLVACTPCHVLEMMYSLPPSSLCLSLVYFWLTLCHAVLGVGGHGSSCVLLRSDVSVFVFTVVNLFLVCAKVLLASVLCCFRL